jgi:hypothetical protein
MPLASCRVSWRSRTSLRHMAVRSSSRNTDYSILLRGQTRIPGLSLTCQRRNRPERLGEWFSTAVLEGRTRLLRLLKEIRSARRSRPRGIGGNDTHFSEYRFTHTLLANRAPSGTGLSPSIVALKVLQISQAVNPDSSCGEAQRSRSQLL